VSEYFELDDEEEFPASIFKKIWPSDKS
jgi:hypothetical protein